MDQLSATMVGIELWIRSDMYIYIYIHVRSSVIYESSLTLVVGIKPWVFSQLCVLVRDSLNQKILYFVCSIRIRLWIRSCIYIHVRSNMINESILTPIERIKHWVFSQLHAYFFHFSNACSIFPRWFVIA